MTQVQRVIVILGLVVVAAIGFVVLKATGDSGDDQPSAQPAATAPATTPSTTGSGAREQARTAPARAAAPAVAKIVVRDLEPVGGVKELVFRKGDMIRFTVVSDQPEEIHLHGYDVADDVAPGRAATFVLPASIEGIFEVELERSGVQIASITVEP
jgi:hypothetical protein